MSWFGLNPAKLQAQGSDRSLFSYGVSLSLGILGVLFVSANAMNGWWPHDDGYLAHAALRTMRGGVPHVDFLEIYTGGLTYLNAWMFRLMGVSIGVLRVPYVGLTVVYSLAVYAISRRWLSREWAALLTISILVLGPTAVNTPTPNAYVTLITGVAVYCLVRFEENRSRAWLLVCGLLLGLAAIIKTTAFYSVLGVSVGLIALHAASRPEGVDRFGRVLVVASGLTTCAFIWPNLTPARLVGLLVPLLAGMAVVLMVHGDAPTEGRPVIDRSTGLLMPFAIGLSVPITGFAAYYMVNGWLGELISGIVGIPGLFLANHGRDLGSSVLLGASFALTWMFVAIVPKRRQTEVWVGWWLLGVTVMTLAVGLPRFAVLGVIVVLANLAPSLAAALLRREVRNSINGTVLAIALVAVAAHLVRFPTSNQWYILYAAPLLILGLVLVLNQIDVRWASAMVLVAAALAVVGTLATFEGRWFSSAPLGLKSSFVSVTSPRLGVRVPEVYSDLDRLLQADFDRPIVVGPDAPELAFLLDIETSGWTDFQALALDGDPPSDVTAIAWSVKPGTVIVKDPPVVSVSASEFIAQLEGRCAEKTLYAPFYVAFQGCDWRTS